MSKDLEVLTDKEEAFINALMENGGKLQEAAEKAGYNPMYAYKLRDRLAQQMPELVKGFLALNLFKAAHHVVNAIDSDNPNPVRLNAAKDVLDRLGVKPKEELDKSTIKANIFILPEKREINVIDANFEPSRD